MGPNIENLLRGANQAHASGNFVEGKRLASQALSLEPKNPTANLLLGVILGKENRLQEAIPPLRRVLESSPNSFEALFWLSTIYRRQGDIAQALDNAHKAVLLRTADPFALNNLGLCQMDALNFEEAVDTFTSALKGKPDSSPTLYNLGTSLHSLGRDLEAAKILEQATTYDPNNLAAYLALGQVLILLTRHAEATQCARKALRLAPDSAKANLLLASALVEDDKPSEAEQFLQKAITLDPRDEAAQALLGLRLQAQGKFGEANEHLRKSIELQPRQGFAYFALTFNNRISESDRPQIERMANVLNGSPLPPREESFLLYGLAKGYEGLKEYETAFAYYDRANALSRKIKFGDESFDPASYSRHYDKIIATFSSEVMAKGLPSPNLSSQPIFIVGMMRSGTTLMEQVLSAHSEVDPLGEQAFWRERLGPWFQEKRPPFPAIAGLAKDYLNQVKSLTTKSIYATDKNPGNYEWLGALHLALPNAKIIHMRRNALDTCFSIFATPNRARINYAHSLVNIAFAYRKYERLMAHWKSLLPAGKLLEVEYESLVSGGADEIKRVAEFLQLDWEESMLELASNGRSILTPSNWQVRQPYYTSSIGRWRNFEPWLGAFRELIR